MKGLETHYEHTESTCDFVSHYLAYLSHLMAQLKVETIAQIIEAFVRAAERGNTIYFIGNGGSAATASHFASDMRLNTRAPGLKPLKAISLVDNVAITTALANDNGYANVFVQQLEDVLHPGDILMALSVSGNSPNVIEAVRYAKEVGSLTIGCTGFDGGKLQTMVDISLHVPTHRGEYGPVEDIFQILDHLIYSYLRLARRGCLTQ